MASNLNPYLLCLEPVVLRDGEHSRSHNQESPDHARLRNRKGRRGMKSTSCALTPKRRHKNLILTKKIKYLIIDKIWPNLADGRCPAAKRRSPASRPFRSTSRRVGATGSRVGARVRGAGPGRRESRRRRESRVGARVGVGARVRGAGPGRRESRRRREILRREITGRRTGSARERF